MSDCYARPASDNSYLRDLDWWRREKWSAEIEYNAIRQLIGAVAKELPLANAGAAALEAHGVQAMVRLAIATAHIDAIKLYYAKLDAEDRAEGNA